jgi:hypothetical protein
MLGIERRELEGEKSRFNKRDVPRNLTFDLTIVSEKKRRIDTDGRYYRTKKE